MQLFRLKSLQNIGYVYDLGPHRRVALASSGGGVDKTMTLDFAAQTVIKIN